MESVRTRLGKNTTDEWDIKRAIHQSAIRLARLTSALTPTTAPYATLVTSQHNYAKSAFSTTDATRTYKVIRTELINAGSESRILPYMSVARFNRLYSTYSVASGGTPELWLQVCEDEYFIYPKPSSTFMSTYPTAALSVYGYIVPDVDSWEDDESIFDNDSLNRLIELHATNSLLIGFSNDDLTQWKQTTLGGMFTEDLTNELLERKHVN